MLSNESLVLQSEVVGEEPSQLRQGPVHHHLGQYVAFNGGDVSLREIKIVLDYIYTYVHYTYTHVHIAYNSIYLSIYCIHWHIYTCLNLYMFIFANEC